MTKKQPTAGIILAAGMSTRFKSPKQLAQWSGKCLVEHVMDHAVASELEKVVLVLGHCFDDIIHTIQRNPLHPKIEIIKNPEYQNGMSTSLKIGLSRVKEPYPSVMFLLGDQPMVDAAFINALLHGFWESDKDIGIPDIQGVRGNPALFSRRFYEALMHVTGDTGGRHILDANPAAIWTMDVEQSLRFLDIDTQKDLDKLYISSS